MRLIRQYLTRLLRCLATAVRWAVAGLGMERNEGIPLSESQKSRDEQIKDFQDRLIKEFSHDEIIGGRYLADVMRQEDATGAAFTEKFYAHRVLTDSLLEFFAETLDEQRQYCIYKGWPKDEPEYPRCLLMYLTLFRTLRATEILSISGYAMPGYALQRSLTDQIFILWAAATKFATFDALFGYPDNPTETPSLRAQARNRLKIERAIRDNIIGKKSGLTEGAVTELQRWESLFNMEIHRGILSSTRMMDELMKGKGFNLGPATDEISESMFLNRSLETNWMIHRLLPYMRRKESSDNEQWARRWKVLDESFSFMMGGFVALGKKIGPAFVEVINKKFNFDSTVCFSAPTNPEPVAEQAAK